MSRIWSEALIGQQIKKVTKIKCKHNESTEVGMYSSQEGAFEFCGLSFTEELKT